jgi:hypothetical protein
MEDLLQDLLVEHLVLRYPLHQGKMDGIHRLDLAGVTILMEMDGIDDYLKIYSTEWRRRRRYFVILYVYKLGKVDSTIAYIISAKYICS